MDPKDEVARLRAAADQAKEEMYEFAGSTHAFYRGCVDQGFTEEQALKLTITWLTETIGAALGGGE